MKIALSCFRFFFSVFSTCLIAWPVHHVIGQDARQLTSFEDTQYRKDAIHALRVFEGKVYAMNIAGAADRKGRFSIIDTSTGVMRSLTENSEFLGESTTIYGKRPFQKLDDKLFAQYRADPTGGELYRIEGERATRLTDLRTEPISDLVRLNGMYYFLVAGRATAMPAHADVKTHYTELWQTDGTPDGTSLVEELPIRNFVDDTGFNVYPRNLLTAGTESLLISGYSTVGGQQYTNYYLYRPGGKLAAVTAPRINGFGSPHVKVFGWGTRPVVAFGSGFYLIGTRSGSTVPELLRIEEASEKMLPVNGMLNGRYGVFGQEDVRFAVVQDSFYLYCNDMQLGQRLYVTGLDAPENFRTIRIAAEGSRSAVITTVGDSIYFAGGSSSGTPALFRYVATTGVVDTLFVRPEFNEAYELLASDGVVYWPGNSGGAGVGRYRIRDDSLSFFLGLNPSGHTGTMHPSLTLIGDAVIYLAEREDWRGDRPPLLLTPEASGPRNLLASNLAAPAGVSFLNGQNHNGSIIFRAPALDTLGRYFRYDTALETVVPIAYPTSEGLYGVEDLRTTVAGGPMVPYCCDTEDGSGFTVHLVSGDSLKPARYADTKEIVRIQKQWMLKYPLIIEEAPNLTSVYRYHFEGLTMVKELRQSISGRGAQIAYLTDDLVRISVSSEEYGLKTGYLLRPDGSLVYQFDYPENLAVLATDTMGYYLLDKPADEPPTIAYYDIGGAETIHFEVPNGVTPVYPKYWLPLYRMVGNRLIFQPHDPGTGTELYVADPATGRITLLRDMHPGSGGSDPHAITRVGDRLFFAAYDPTHGTELWRTDGTPQGTYLVSDINPGVATSNPGNFELGQNQLYFRATSDVGAEAYAVDLESEMVRLLADISPGGGGSYPEQFLETKSGLYVLARTHEEAGKQLFRIQADGNTTNVTSMMPEVGYLSIFPNPASNSVVIRAQAGDYLEQLRLFNMTGSLLRTVPVNGSETSLSTRELPSGHYFVVARYRSGTFSTGKLVVTQ
ncbi:MAG: ELWxxDGT repeat protein [Lewinella sp.]